MSSSRKRKRKAELFAEQRGLCFWCQKKMHFARTTFDHLIPRSRGGGNDRGNQVLAHSSCNMARGNLIWPFGKTPPHAVSA
jgi:5-methylcytosine-specific restriction endonuclease McrA